jgi:hypothetical protein
MSDEPAVNMTDVYKHMLRELLFAQPTTIKAPGREGGYVRIPVEQNPSWYREICRARMGTRKRYPKPRTKIRRVDVERALLRLVHGIPNHGEITELVRAAARRYLNEILESIRRQPEACDDTALPEF